MTDQNAVPKKWFEETPDSIVVLVSGLDIIPTQRFNREGEQELMDTIVLQCDDLTGRFPDGTTQWFTPSNHPNSKWQKWLKVVKAKSGVKVRSSKDLVGRYFIAEFHQWEWGGGLPASRVLELVEELPGLEVAETKAREFGGGSTTSSTGATFDDLTDEQKVVIELIDGKTYEAFLTEAVTDARVSSNPALLTRLVDPQRLLVEAMIDLGYLNLTDDETYSASQ